MAVSYSYGVIERDEIVVDGVVDGVIDKEKCRWSDVVVWL